MTRTRKKTPAKAKRVQTKRSDCTPSARSGAAANPQVGGDLPPQNPASVQSGGGEGAPLSWDQAFQLYEDHLRCRRSAASTIYAHKRALILLRDALSPAVAGPTDVEIGHLRRYQLSLLNRRLSAGTVANTTCQIRSFFRFLYLEELLEKDPAGRLEPPKVPLRPPGVVLNPHEVQRLLEATAEHKFPLLAKAVVETLYCTAVRRGELFGFDLFDLDHRDRTLLVRAGKGEKARLLPVAPACYDALSRYLEYGRPELERSATTALFLGPKGGRLNEAYLSRLFQELQDRAGIEKKITAHCFRRTCATGLLNNGTNLKVIQAILGHANLHTTSVYLCLSPEEVRGEVLSRHPRERFDA